MIYSEVKNYLTSEPRARERMNKDRAMVNLLLTKYSDLKEINKDKLIDFCHDFESYNRLWRKVTEENVDLRGSDYDTKQEVEEKKMLELGYEPNYHNDMKQLKMI